MKNLSLKLKDTIFQEVEKVRLELKIPRNTYINDALSLYNKFNKRKKLKNQLEQESLQVRTESLSILKELEALD